MTELTSLPRLDPCILIIFGITGDLARRKVLPALYQLCEEEILAQETRIVGISRREIPLGDLFQTIEKCVNESGDRCDPEVLNRLRASFSMVKLDPLNGNDYQELSRYLDELEAESGRCLERLFYLSIPPQVYTPIVKKLGEYKLNLGCHQHENSRPSRLLVEKPFGYDYASAEQLIKETEEVFSEQQIFRIDHYLAKETAQNILKFRRHNPVFSSQWDARHIRKIHVLAKEEIGIENRVAFYEQVGAMRDLVQSHLLQMLALTAMDIPKELTSDEIHARKIAFLRQLRPPSAEKGIASQVIRGQYHSYREEVANPRSNIETFVSMNLKSSDPAWENCIFQLTTGKALDEKKTLISIMFGDDDTNVLNFRIQPDEGIDIELVIEQPGFAHNLKKVKLNFSYADSFSSRHDAYERVLIDAIRGDHLLFATKDEVLATWQLLQPIIDQWAWEASDLELYDNGTPGPDISKRNSMPENKQS